jgi:hypothetical protein
VAGSLHRLPTRPKQTGASKGRDNPASPRSRTRSSNPSPSSEESAANPESQAVPISGVPSETPPRPGAWPRSASCHRLGRPRSSAQKQAKQTTSPARATARPTRSDHPGVLTFHVRAASDVVGPHTSPVCATGVATFVRRFPRAILRVLVGHSSALIGRSAMVMRCR